ncbi:hypothetical protein A33I_20930 [Alkalihalophilus marmarensis DSM 21297]|uniref:Uncharacterized protein n=1 Tax=Alkalihalophilus marmarensis DSM 21297 TaxID=1188261 RepID=U6SJL6_9BACI|nr:hypothetical protein A33I_20930 [Alkalihalophilus marmarensis DSM 21297]
MILIFFLISIFNKFLFGRWSLWNFVREFGLMILVFGVKFKKYLNDMLYLECFIILIFDKLKIVFNKRYLNMWIGEIVL